VSRARVAAEATRRFSSAAAPKSSGGRSREPQSAAGDAAPSARRTSSRRASAPGPAGGGLAGEDALQIPRELRRVGVAPSRVWLHRLQAHLLEARAAAEPRFLQAWYRDPSGPCGFGFNTTNALAVAWAP